MAQPKRILVVDDDPDIRETLTRFLETEGYQVDTAADGEAGMQAVRESPPDLLLLDLDLPELNGLEVLRRILVEQIHLPVITISGHPHDDLVGGQSVKLGAAHFIAKPIDFEHLKEILLTNLSVASDEHAASDTAAVSEPTSTPGPTTMPDAASYRILVVDDDENIREVLSRFLSDRNYQVETATNGAEALEVLERKAPDVMLLDIDMPEMNGLEVLRHVEAKGIEVGIIMISGYPDEDVARKTLQLGAADFIVKPLDHEYLETSLIAKLLTL